MADKREHKLTAIGVSSLNKPGLYGDGLGLWLQVTQVGDQLSKSWIFRFRRRDGAGKLRYMGLGPTHTISLKEARDRARAARQQLLDGIDPIEARREKRQERQLEAAKAITFNDAGERYIAAHEAGWKNGKHRHQWKATLASSYLVIGDLPVNAIDTGLVLKVLEPMWKATPETASRLRGRIERVLSWATTRGYRTGDNPARWRGHLDQLLAKRSKVQPVQHFPAMPFDQLPQFMMELRKREGVAARALEFAILTAARTNETIGAVWSEIDLKTGTWTIPASRMKAGREHRVPLCDRALTVLKDLPCEEGNGFVFIGNKKGAPLRSMAMLELMKFLCPTYVPHGFRSTFRDWCAERTGYPNHIVEKALAHAAADKVEAAYQRSDLFDKRRKLMADWARFCETPKATGEVVSFKGGAL
jgi:integrase